MKSAIIVARVLFGLAGLAQLVLGILVWLGYALELIPLHMLLGAVFVLLLWVIAVLGFSSGSGTGFGFLLLAWGVVVALLGMYQVQLLPGPRHWIIEWLHLLVGVAAMGLGQTFVRRMLARTRPEQASAGAA